MSGPGALFEERQRPPAALAAVAVAVMVAAAVVALAASPRADGILWQLWLAPVLAVAGIALIRMRTVVTQDHLRVTIVPFPRKTFPLSEIARCEPVTYRPLRDYGGWGWRWSPSRGWAYTMRGTRGVMVHRRNGKTFLVGSQRPAELAAAIEAGAGATPGPR